MRGWKTSQTTMRRQCRCTNEGACAGKSRNERREGRERKEKTTVVMGFHSMRLGFDMRKKTQKGKKEETKIAYGYNQMYHQRKKKLVPYIQNDFLFGIRILQIHFYQIDKSKEFTNMMTRDIIHIRFQQRNVEIIVELRTTSIQLCRLTMIIHHYTQRN